MKKVGACFYPQNIRRAARKFLSAQGASPEQWANTSVRVLCLKSIWRFDRQWERLQRVFTLRISGAPPESSFPLKARRPNSGRTLLYAFYAWNLSDVSIGNEKGYSVFLPSEYQARRPKVPFRSRRVARTVGEHFCTRFMLEIYLTFRSAMRKVTACFYPQNIRRAARKFLSAQSASPEQWVNTSVRFILEIYLTVRSAMRKVTACFYPQNIRRAARKFLSAQSASPEQWVNTSVRVLCLKSIWRFDRQWERLQRVFTLRTSGAPPESSFPLKARRPNSGWTLLYAFYAWNLSDVSIGNEKGHSVFLPSEHQARRPKVPFRSRRVARTVGEHFCTLYTWNLSDGSIGNEKGHSVFLPSEHQARRPKVPFRSKRVARTVGEHFCTRFMLEIYLTFRSAMRKVTACFYPQNIRRAARKFLSAQGASPEQWVNTSVRCILEIYLTVRSAMRKVTACFYPQNIRRAARKFLSVQSASPEQWAKTSVRFILGILSDAQ